MKCIVVDDEPLAVEILESFCNKTPYLKLQAAFTDALQALHYLLEHPVDLMFLDINMPDLSGIQLVKALEPKPLLVFTTAYPQHAVTGFELDAVDYLLKPIAFDRFLKAVHKARQRKAAEKIEPSTELKDLDEATASSPDVVFLKTGFRHQRMNVSDILYLQSEKNYVNFITAAKRVMVLISMDQALAMLPPGKFVRIHKSYSVALDHIAELDKHSVYVHQRELPIGNTYRQALFQAIEPSGPKPS